MAAEWFLTDAGGGAAAWALPDVETPDSPASAPASVSASATGGTTLLIEWVPGAGGGVPTGFDVELESPTGSGTWVAAAGAANPTAAGVVSFAATGLSVVTQYTPRVRAKRTGQADSAWTVGAAVFTDNSVTGGAVIGASDVTSPSLTGSIAISALTSTSYTATCPPASDAVGVTGYQWRLGGAGAWTDIASGGRVANFAGRTPASTDSLEMRARDAAGNFSAPLSTSVALLGIAPTVTTQPVNVSVAAGALATFTAAFSGTPAPSRQWFRNGVAISGATGLSYSLTTVLGDSGAVFTCTATNSAGSVTTNAAVLTVTALAVAPSITTQPAPQSSLVGSPVTFSVVAAGTSPLAYQWLRNGAAIAGATSDSYTFTPGIEDNGADFSVTVTNGAGNVTSSPATLTVTVPLEYLTFQSLIYEVLPYVPGCPDQSVVTHLRSICIDFFQKTLAWRQKLNPVTALADVTTYTMPLPDSQTALAKLLAYWIDGQRAHVVQAERGEDLAACNSSADVAWTTTRATFSVSPAPDAGQLLVLDVALKPSQASTGVLASLWEHYADALVDGALSRIFAMPNQPWTNPGLAQYHGQLYQDAIDSVGAATAKSFSRAGGRTRPFMF